MPADAVPGSSRSAATAPQTQHSRLEDGNESIGPSFRTADAMPIRRRLYDTPAVWFVSGHPRRGHAIECQRLRQRYADDVYPDGGVPVLRAATNSAICWICWAVYPCFA